MSIQLRHAAVVVLVLFSSGILPACGSNGTEAQRRGVGASCTADTDCTESGQKCLAFKGGYCGIADCLADVDCPPGSACVAHTDGHNYCFLVCTDKIQCNQGRSVGVESNCSANITFTSGSNTLKACVPPAG